MERITAARTPRSRRISEVVDATTQTTPNDATHWSCRSMARHLNTTHSFVNRVWRAHGLKPHLIRTFTLSSDPRFEEKLRDPVALYLDPPHNAAVFSFDEKSQIQALDRTQPGLPMKKGRCATMTHDYKRHVTTRLFAALNMATGEVIGKTYRKHRHQEVLRFLREVDKTVPKEQEIHIVLDNYATHKHDKVLAWIERKKRVFLHFIPTSASWGNLVDRFFGILTQKQIRRGVIGAAFGEVLARVFGELQRESTRLGLDKVRRGNPRKGPSGSSGVTQDTLITNLLRTLH